MSDKLIEPKIGDYFIITGRPIGSLGVLSDGTIGKRIEDCDPAYIYPWYFFIIKHGDDYEQSFTFRAGPGLYYYDILTEEEVTLIILGT